MVLELLRLKRKTEPSANAPLSSTATTAAQTTKGGGSGPGDSSTSPNVPLSTSMAHDDSGLQQQQQRTMVGGGGAGGRPLHHQLHLKSSITSQHGFVMQQDESANYKVPLEFAGDDGAAEDGESRESAEWANRLYANKSISSSSNSSNFFSVGSSSSQQSIANGASIATGNAGVAPGGGRGAGGDISGVDSIDRPTHQHRSSSTSSSSTPTTPVSATLPDVIYGTSASARGSAASATPSRSSSDSNGRRFTIGTTATTNTLGYSLPDTPPHTPGFGTMSTVSGVHQQKLQQTPVIYCTPGAGSQSLDDRGAASLTGSVSKGVTSVAEFVMSPTTFQPPAALSGPTLKPQQQGYHTAYPADSFQFRYMPALAASLDSLHGESTGAEAETGAGAGEASTHEPLHTNIAHCDTILHQQQRYQQAQLQQFRQDLGESPAAAVATALRGHGQGQGQAEHWPRERERTISASGYAADQGKDPSLSPVSHVHFAGPGTLISTGPSPAPMSAPPGTQRSGAGGVGNGGHSVATTPTDNHGNGHAGGLGSGGGGMVSPPVSRASTFMTAAPHLIMHDLRATPEQTHIEEGPGPVVLMAIGKTGQGKSSLLNRIMGTTELKASASVRAVTKGIAERTGWGRFEESRRVLVTISDTPGLADTEGDDEKNIPILKEYIKSIGTRLGVTAFLLVFKIDSGQAYNEIMKDFPNFWDNVILVFTGCDYRRDVLNTKELYHREVQDQLVKYFASQ
ncbi:hypothetical protein BGW38_004768, partial [Lunasporangiospora selenospora]